MNVLSLFDGISCGQIALNRAGIKIDNYYASEIDEYAIKVTQANFPNTIQLGDVTKIDVTTLPKIDLICGGSPCQSVSLAGRQEGFDGKSGLFFEYVRILNQLREINPDILFLLENVKMKKEWQDVITKHMGVKPILINSSLVSAQNRNRLYWTNIQGVTQPEDKHILLKDILETGVVDRDKSFCIDANYWKGTNLTQYLTKSRRQIVFTERRTAEAKEIRREYAKKYGRDYSPRRAKELVPREDDKCNTLTTSLSKEHILLDESLNFRKLTPLECERLQTINDNYTSMLSNTQRYKVIGNGWTIDVISWIFSFI